MGRGRLIDQSQWPRDRPRRTFFELLDEVHRKHGIKSLSEIAEGMNLSARSRVSTLLRGTLPVDEGQVEDLIRALGGSAGDIDRGLMIYRVIQSAAEDADRSALRGPAKRGAAIGEVRAVNPLELGIHPAVLPPGITPLRLPALTAYLRRGHDDRLRAELSLAAEGGQSVLVILVGNSTVGKTRALYEALCAVVPDWQLLWPRDADELLDVLEAGRFRRGTVMWLDETQRYLYGKSGAKAAIRLSRVLARTPGAIAVGAMWHRPYLADFIERGGPGDPHAAARDLLEGSRTRRLVVPDHLVDAQMDGLAELAGWDPRLAAALAGSGPGGHVIQHLTSGPELVDGYTSGGLFASAEHALVTAALDARRLGHQAPIPQRLLTAAADGYLSPWQRPGEANWNSGALEAITTGKRADGSRTAVRSALTALRVYRTSSGSVTAAYEPDDYLDEHIRAVRQTQLGPPQLWDALVDSTRSPEDLNRLGQAAYCRGLYRYAARLWHRAAAAGHAEAAVGLIRASCRLRDGSITQVSIWVAERIDLDDPWSVASLLAALAKFGEPQAVASVLDRDPVAHAAVGNPRSVAGLMAILHEVAAPNAVAALAAKAAAHTPFDDPYGLVDLLGTMIEVGAFQAIESLLARDLAQAVPIDDPGGVALLLQVLRALGEDQAVAALADRAAARTSLDRPTLTHLLGALHRIGAKKALATLASRTAERAPLDTLVHVTGLLASLDEIGADKALARLSRRAAAEVPLKDPYDRHQLLNALRRAEQDDAVTTLQGRDPERQFALDSPEDFASALWIRQTAGTSEAAGDFDGDDAAAHARLDDPYAVANLLNRLRQAREDRAVATLLARKPAEYVRLDDPLGVAFLLKALHKSGVQDEVATLAWRAATDAPLHHVLGSHVLVLGSDDLPDRLREVGADRAAATLLSRMLNAGVVRPKVRWQPAEFPLDGNMFTQFVEVTAGPHEVEQLLRFGREPDGMASQPWGWPDIHALTE
jgi:hypothetical protein